MEAFRTLIRGWLGKVLLALFLVPFALVGIDGYFAGNNSANTAAKVGDRDISQTELDRAITTQRDQLLSQVNNDASRVDDALLHDMILDNLIARAVLLNQASKLGFQLSPNQIGELIRKEPSFQENGVFSDQLFENYLKSTNMDRNALMASVRDSVALQQLVGGLSDTSIAVTKEQSQLAKMQSESRTVHLVNLPLTRYIPDIKITDEQIAAYYKQHKADYQTVPSVDLNYITLDSTRFVDQATVTDADIQQRYQQLVASSNNNAERHARHILLAVDSSVTDPKKLEQEYAAALDQATKLEARLAAGEDFAVLAKEFSKDPGSAINGGDLGFAPKGTYVPEFEASIDELKANEISKPVKTQFGYHIIQLIETRQPDAPTLESVRPQLEAEARQAKADILYSDMANEINEQAVTSDQLSELAKAQGLTVQTAPAFTKAGGEGDLAHPDLRAMAFSDDQLLDHHVSNGINISPTRTMWIQVSNYKPMREKTLVEASNLIKSKLLIESAGKKAAADAKAIAKDIKAGIEPNVAAQKFGMSFNEIGPVTRTTGLPDQKMQAAVFGLQKTKAGEPWQATTIDLDRIGSSVVAISDVTEGNADSISEDERKQLGELLTKLHGQQDLEDYVDYLKSKAKIEKVKHN
jgi:peptidyl-prolyl cis-trans isomerase D